jgi:two-component system chemotaxis sensor kinase CheA
MKLKYGTYHLNPESPELITNSDLLLSGLSETIPYQYDEITQANFGEERLYAIHFDVDENCMVFGNDPVYALSLMNEKLISIYNCFNTDTAKELIAGFADEDDDLLLRSNIIGIVYATFEELEDAIYNFLDECYITPLDIRSLTEGMNLPITSDVDIIKDVIASLNKGIEEQNVENIKSSINEALGLINRSSNVAIILRRILHLASISDSSDLHYLGNLIGKLGGEASVAPASTPSAQPEPKSEEAPKEEPKETPAASSAPVEVTDKDREVIEVMLVQQHEQLINTEDEEMIARVEVIIKKCATFLSEDCGAASKQDMLVWLEQRIGDKVVCVTDAKPITTSEPTPEPAVVVEEKQPEPVKEEPKAVETPKAEEPKAAPAPEPVKETPKPAAKKEAPKADKPKAEPKKDVIGKVVKIEQESIDNLMSIVGELLVAKNSLPYLADGVVDMESEQIKRSILEKYSFINRLSNQLQELIISMRMLPISYVFDRYPKLVRDISKKLDKKVKLVQEGADTKLDKNVIEMLADPLIHIVRNSLDHGLEGEDERVESGKAKTGELIMRAYPESDKVVIEIIDDGRGINTERVAQKIIEKGLLTQEQIDKMDDNEKAQLVMLPGLSTAESISEYSGRGVGMDVVKKSIEGFGGSIDIQTTQGRGTKIVLSIPVSLAVSKLLQVSMNGNNYGFPMDLVSETVKINSEDITYLNNDPYIYIRGQVIPILFINQMLQEQTKESKILSLVIISVKGNQLAIVVNELLGQIDVVQKPLDGILENHPLFSGAALLGNGQIIMILDSIGLFEMQSTQGA